LSILTPPGKVTQQFEATHLRKGEDGTRLTCHVSSATATLVLERAKNLPELHVLASLFFPLFEAVYQIDLTEQERFIEWVNCLGIGVLASSRERCPVCPQAHHLPLNLSCAPRGSGERSWLKGQTRDAQNLQTAAREDGALTLFRAPL
jgi:hypothetical protein